MRRLFPDHRRVEQDYFKRTGIFPIMHAVAVRRDVAAEHAWLPRAVFDAYVAAKVAAYRQMSRIGWADNMQPWFGQEREDTKALMGANFYPYGIAPNRRALQTLLRYSYTQGLAARELDVDELFEPSCLTCGDEL